MFLRRVKFLIAIVVLICSLQRSGDVLAGGQEPPNTEALYIADMLSVFDSVSSEYSPELAELSVKAAEYVAEYRSQKLTELLDRLGFENIEHYNFNDKNADNCGFVLAYKRLPEYCVIAVILNGTEGNEWFGNFKVWESSGKPGTEHYSFAAAQNDISSMLRQYVYSNEALKDSERNKIWITGHSRGAGVANLLAARLSTYKLSRIAEPRDIFAYTFAAPNVTTEPNYKLNNIFNFVNEDDFISFIPLSDWGYGKHGITVSYSTRQLGGFDTAEKTKSVVDEIYALADSADEYYNKAYSESPSLPSLHAYANAGIAAAAQGSLEGKIVIISTAYNENSPYMRISQFFVGAALANIGGTDTSDSIFTAHNPQAYAAIVDYYNESVK